MKEIENPPTGVTSTDPGLTDRQRLAELESRFSALNASFRDASEKQDAMRLELLTRQRAELSEEIGRLQTKFAQGPQEAA